MIFYFTGTGNSYWVAKQIQISFPGELHSIPGLLKNKEKELSFTVNNTENIFFIFPVHSWGPPGIVLDFIRQLTLKNYQNQPVYGICTCGDDCGYTATIFQKSICQKGWQPEDFYSIQMPNTYLLFPGFDIDSPEVEKKKLSDAVKSVSLISNSIHNKLTLDLYTQGSMPFIKSRLIYPLFNKFVLGKTSFYSTEKCISCGLCEKICPTGTITMQGGKPVWDNRCIQCLGCLHRCPQRAIEYGKITIKKGRYHHPEIK